MVPSGSASASSWMRIVSAPSGTGAPVKMRTAFAGRNFADERTAGRPRGADDLQGGAHGGVRGAKRVAVHGAAVEGWLAVVAPRVGGCSTRPVAPASGTALGAEGDARKMRSMASSTEQAHSRGIQPRTCRRVFSSRRMPVIRHAAVDAPWPCRRGSAQRDRSGGQRFHLDPGLAGRLGRCAVIAEAGQSSPRRSRRETLVSGSGWQSGISSRSSWPP